MRNNSYGKIVAAAVFLDGTIYQLPQPKRHADILHMMSAQGLRAQRGDQGFVAETGKFVCRKFAAQIAKHEGQVTDLINPSIGLFSEDLW